MKMGIVKVCGLLATSILHLILLVDSTAACPTLDFEKYYCSADVVLKGKFQNIDKEEMPLMFKINKVYKGPRDLKEVKFNRASVDACRYHPESISYEYLIAGHKRNGEIHIICDYSEAWEFLDQLYYLYDILEKLSNNYC